MPHRIRNALLLLATIAAADPGTDAAAAPPMPPDQQEFCALIERLRATSRAADEAARQIAVEAARREIEAFIAGHRGIDWVGKLDRVISSSADRAAVDVETCPAAWVGGVSPEGTLDSDSWADSGTRLFNELQAAMPGETVEFRAALLGFYATRPDFPMKLWVRARLVDLSPAGP
jgi:hypothetical protein